MSLPPEGVKSHPWDILLVLTVQLGLFSHPFTCLLGHFSCWLLKLWRAAVLACLFPAPDLGFVPLLNLHLARAK